MRLRREIAHDHAAMARHSGEARELLQNWSTWSHDPGGLARAAVALHAWYTGLETLIERVLRQLDRGLPAGDASHRDMLFQATGEIPKVRPAVIPAELVDDLLELLAFRHFFRHAYAVNMDSSRLEGQLSRLVRIAPQIEESLNQFDAFLESALEAVAQ